MPTRAVSFERGDTTAETVGSDGTVYNGRYDFGPYYIDTYPIGNDGPIPTESISSDLEIGALAVDDNNYLYVGGYTFSTMQDEIVIYSPHPHRKIVQTITMANGLPAYPPLSLTIGRAGHLTFSNGGFTIYEFATPITSAKLIRTFCTTRRAFYTTVDDDHEIFVGGILIDKPHSFLVYDRRDTACPAQPLRKVGPAGEPIDDAGASTLHDGVLYGIMYKKQGGADFGRVYVFNPRLGFQKPLAVLSYSPFTLTGFVGVAP